MLKVISGGSTPFFTKSIPAALLTATTMALAI
jgi:hypothetical protein